MLNEPKEKTTKLLILSLLNWHRTVITLFLNILNLPFLENHFLFFLSTPLSFLRLFQSKLCCVFLCCFSLFFKLFVPLHGKIHVTVVFHLTPSYPFLILLGTVYDLRGWRLLSLQFPYLHTSRWGWSLGSPGKRLDWERRETEIPPPYISYL
jgi:hypothetical protein